MISICELLNRINLAKDEHLLMSRMNCHGKGLHSIVIGSSNGKLTRFFITDQEHMMYKNVDNNFNINLGIHNHRYAIRLTGITGDALNIGYVEDEKLCNVSKYQFTSKIDGGVGALYLGLSGLRLGSVSVIDDIFIPQDGLHTVYVPRGCISCWLVSEGAEISRSVSLFQNGSAESSSYDTFESADDVRSFCKQLIDRIK